jgi:hypothetical protein
MGTITVNQSREKKLALIQSGDIVTESKKKQQVKGM